MRGANCGDESAVNELFSVQYCWLIPLLPLVGAAVAGFFGAKWLKGASHWPIWIGVGVSAVLSVMLLVGMLGLQKHEAEPAHETASAEHAPSARIDLRPFSEQFPLIATRNLFTWLDVGTPDANGHTFKIDFGYFFDPLTAVMLCVVCGIGFLITVFAAGYMKGEEGYFRFFAYLGLFIFMMTNLVMGENLIMLYLGWEGVGLCSYLLIGYYYDKPAAREAAKKAFLVNRVGDFGFALGIMLCFLAFGTVSYFGNGAGTNTGLLELARGAANPENSLHWAYQWIPFLLMLGAFGKSAQFPLYVWLPDAMEGPTPVSALIHAATMVTAGVYMIARCGTLFVGNEAAMWTVTIVGAFTAIFAATIALRQFDLKKVFAYSTVSQLGFMFVGVGLLAPVAGVFHLVTHAFFKALLFLSSGVVMHAMAGELDMRKFSGLKRTLPKTRWLMLIGCLALAGVPLFSGFFSKDEIVGNAWEHSKVIGIVMLFTAFLTAYYTFRLYFRVFEGPEVLPEPSPDAHGHGHDDHAHHNHEPAIMILPLVVLAIGAVLAGYLNWPKESLGEFLGQSPSLAHAYETAIPAYKPELVNPIPFGNERGHAELKKINEEYLDASEATHKTLMFVSGAIAVLGILLAYRNHLQDRARAERLAASVPELTHLIENKYFVDEIYQAGIVEPLRSLGRAFFAIDRFVVDGMVWLISFVPQLSGFALRITTQRGYLQGYAVTMLFGVVVILAVIFW